MESERERRVRGEVVRDVAATFVNDSGLMTILVTMRFLSRWCESQTLSDLCQLSLPF